MQLFIFLINNELIDNSLYDSNILHFQSNSAIINLGAKTSSLERLEQMILGAQSVFLFYQQDLLFIHCKLSVSAIKHPIVLFFGSHKKMWQLSRFIRFYCKI